MKPETFEIIKRSAGYHARGAEWAVETDELCQIMALNVLEAEAKTPNFADQEIGYSLQRAAWAAKNALRSGRIEFKHIPYSLDAMTAIDPEILDENRKDQETLQTVDRVDPHFEQTFVLSETINAALQVLDDRDRIIVTLLYEGYSPAEIADELKISRPLVSKRRKVIQETFKKYL